MVSTHFQIPRRLFYLYNRIIHPSDQEVMEKVGAFTNYAEKVAIRKRSPQTDEPPRTDLAPYATNLETIAGLARVHGFELAFMTQQTTWASAVDPDAERWHWTRCQQGTTYREDHMDTALKAYNAAMREVGQRRNLAVFDLEREMPKSTEYFYDDIHFNVRGAALAGELLAEFLVNRGLPSDRPEPLPPSSD